MDHSNGGSHGRTDIFDTWQMRMTSGAEPRVYEGFIPAPDPFGVSFQDGNSQAIGNGGYDGVNLDDDYDGGDGFEDGPEADPNAMPSIELPEFGTPYSSSEADATTPGSYDDASDSADETEDVEMMDPDAVSGADPDSAAIPMSRPVLGLRARRSRQRRRTGKRGGWSQGLKVGPRPPLEPSAEFTSLYQAAMRAYNFDDDLDTAHELVVEAIALNPEVFNAHILLADIWFARGESSNAVQALWTGAHCYARDPFVWRMVVEACLMRATYARQIALNQAKYALKAILKLDDNDQDARFQLASVEREAGRPKKALDLLDKVMLAMPHNTDALRLYAETCISMQKNDVAISRYKEAILYYRTNGLSDDDSFEWADVNTYAKLLSLRDGKRDDILSTSIIVLKRLSRWLQGRPSETFWDKVEDDDREFDIDDLPRRIELKSYRPGRYHPEQYGLGLPMEIRVQLGILRLKQGDARDEALNHFAYLEPDDVAEDANVHQFPDEFFSVASALNEAIEHREALRYFEALLRVDSEKDIEFWIGIGISTYICDQKDRALQHFQAALALDDDSVVANTYVSKILAEKGDKLLAVKYACEAVESASAAYPPTLHGTRKYERFDNRAEREAAEGALRLALAIPGPAPPKKRKGRILADGTELNAFELIKPRGVLVPKPGKRKSKRPPRPPTPAEDRPSKVDDIRPIYNTLLNNYEAMQEGDSVATRIWMSCAKTLINDFRANEAFYPSQKHKSFQIVPDEPSTVNTPTKPSTPSDPNHPFPSIEPTTSTTLPTTYRSIPLPTWLDIFLEYALLTSRLPLSATPTANRETHNTISAATSCMIWHNDPSALFLIHSVHLSCAVNLRDQIALFGTILPWFTRHYPFSTSAYRLFLAFHSLFPFPNHPQGKAGQMETAYIATSSKASRSLFRHVHAVDTWLLDDYTDPTTGETVPEFMRRPRDDTLSFYTTDPITNEQVPIRTAEMDVVLLVLYGQLLYAKNQFLSALVYFHRARALDPGNAVVALVMALCYMQQPLKTGYRSGGDEVGRHRWVVMGLALLEEYARLREREVEGLGEQRRGEVRREVHFNRARAWGMLGLGGLAVEGFERVLKDGDGKRGQDGTDDVDMQAAYAMATTYALNGDVIAARKVTERYLVVE